MPFRPMPDYARQRQQMVEMQLVRRGIRDPLVLEAMLRVPRERFVDERFRASAYDDSPLPIAEGQTISQPYVVAAMIEALELRRGDRVLEVGSGSGYAAAVLGRIAEKVYAVERHVTLIQQAQRRYRELDYDNIELRHADGTTGWPEHAPYDAILVSAGAPEVPATLLAQLDVGGRMVIPIGRQPHIQTLVRVRRRPDRIERESLGDVRFVPLVGAEGWDGESDDASPSAAPTVPADTGAGDER